MKNSTRTISLGLVVACATISIGGAIANPASAAASAPAHPQSHARVTDTPRGPINQLIVANMSGHPLDMTVTTGEGTTLHSVVEPGRGWYPESDYSGRDTIVVKDDGGVAFVGSFTYDADWVAGTMTPSPRLRYTWHTGMFGGFDFR